MRRKRNTRRTDIEVFDLVVDQSECEGEACFFMFVMLSSQTVPTSSLLFSGICHHRPLKRSTRFHTFVFSSSDELADLFHGLRMLRMGVERKKSDGVPFSVRYAFAVFLSHFVHGLFIHHSRTALIRVPSCDLLSRQSKKVGTPLALAHSG